MDSLLDKLNRETSTVRWTALGRFFAAGRVLSVRDGEDLLVTAAALARDDAEAVRGWLDSGRLQPVSDDDARRWQAQDALLWAVVIRPWILVQPAAAADPDDGG